MDSRQEVNERVDVVATFGTGLDICIPRKIRRPNGREIDVTELGLRHPTVYGKRTIHVFEVTDGGSDYRLAFDAERLTWHLTHQMSRDA